MSTDWGKSNKRLIKGNPPGKNGSLGDAIAWEILLSDFKKDKVCIISKDGDWKDCLDYKRLNLFLEKEWQGTHTNEIVLFSTVSEFLIKIAKVEIPKEVAEQEEKKPAPQVVATSPFNIPGYTLSQSASGGVVVYTPNGVTTIPGPFGLDLYKLFDLPLPVTDLNQVAKPLENKTKKQEG